VRFFSLLLINSHNLEPETSSRDAITLAFFVYLWEAFVRSKLGSWLREFRFPRPALKT
jgi:hypothetical protein